MTFDFGKYFGEIKLSHDLQTTPEERSWLLKPPRDGERHDVILYLGCNVLRTSHMVQTATAVFDRLGIDYVAAGGAAYCCGIQHHRYASAESGAQYGNHTIELLPGWRRARSSCGARRASTSTTRCCSRTCRSPSATPPSSSPSAWSGATSRSPTGSRPPSRCTPTADEARQREGRAARRLLEAVPGIRLVEFQADARFGRSCSPTLPVSSARRCIGRWSSTTSIARWPRAPRTSPASTTAAIVSCCRFEAERPIVFEHYLTLFARALGIEFEDTYKKYCCGRSRSHPGGRHALHGGQRRRSRGGARARDQDVPGQRLKRDSPWRRSALERTTAVFAAEHDVPIPYMQRTRDYYLALGFSAVSLGPLRRGPVHAAARRRSAGRGWR